MYCKAGVACTNPEVYGDIKRGRRLAPSKGIVCPRCQGKCCNEACLEKHKCKQRARPSTVHTQSMRLGPARWQIDPSSFELKPYDVTGANLGLADPMTVAALNAGFRGQGGGLILPQGQQYPQGIVLGTGPGGNMMPIIPVMPLHLMFNPAALQQAGAEGGMQAAELLAVMQLQQSAGMAATAAGAASAPMMLASMAGQDGTPTAASAAAASASQAQALQLAQLQGLAANGQLPLLQLAMQPDGSGGLMHANGQRLQLPAGMLQTGMLPGGLQVLSAEGLQLAADGSGHMQMMGVMPQDAAGVSGADQATVDAAVAAAAAAGTGAAGLPMMGGLAAMGAGMMDATGALAAEQQTMNHAAQGLEHHPGAVSSSTAAAGDTGIHPGAVDVAALQSSMGPPTGSSPLGVPAMGTEGQPTDLAAAAQQAGELQQGFDEAAAAANAASAAASAAPGEVPSMAEAAVDGSSLPAIAPLHMSPAIAEALKAVASGRAPPYNAEEDAAAAALMSLATDKKKKAAAAAAAAQAAAAAANEGIISQAAAAAAIEEARQLAEEAEAEERAAAAEAKLVQAQQEQQHLHKQQLDYEHQQQQQLQLLQEQQEQYYAQQLAEQQQQQQLQQQHRQQHHAEQGVYHQEGVKHMGHEEQ